MLWVVMADFPQVSILRCIWSKLNKLFLQTFRSPQPAQPSFQIDNSEDTPRHVPSTSKSSTNKTSPRSNSRQNCASVASMEWNDPLDEVIIMVEKREQGDVESGEPVRNTFKFEYVS